MACSFWFRVASARTSETSLTKRCVRAPTSSIWDAKAGSCSRICAMSSARRGAAASNRAFARRICSASVSAMVR